MNRETKHKMKSNSFETGLSKKLGRLLECPICFEHFNTAMIIPGCSHNFCSLCIRRYVNSNTQCPLCLKQVWEPELKPNRLLDEIVTTFVKLQESVDVNSDHESGDEDPSRKDAAIQCSPCAGSGDSNTRGEAQHWRRPKGKASRIKIVEDSDSDDDFGNALTGKCRSSKHNQEQSDNKQMMAEDSDSSEEIMPKKTQRGKSRDKSNNSKLSSIIDLVDVLTSESSSGDYSEENDEIVKKRKVPTKKSQGCQNQKMNKSHENLQDKDLVTCPVCLTSVRDTIINMHLDSCLSKQKMKGCANSGKNTAAKSFFQPSSSSRESKPAASSSREIKPTPASTSSSTSSAAGAISKAVPSSSQHSQTAPVKRRQPLTKLVYRLMKDAEIRKCLKEHGLSCVGSTQELIRRHHEFTLLYNSECDSVTPRPVHLLVKQIETMEKTRNKSANTSAGLNIKKGASEAEIQREKERYLRQHKSHFNQLVQNIKERDMSKKAPATDMENDDTLQNEEIEYDMQLSHIDNDISTSLRLVQPDFPSSRITHPPAASKEVGKESVAGATHPPLGSSLFLHSPVDRELQSPTTSEPLWEESPARPLPGDVDEGDNSKGCGSSGTAGEKRAETINGSTIKRTNILASTLDEPSCSSNNGGGLTTAGVSETAKHITAATSPSTSSQRRHISENSSQCKYSGNSAAVLDDDDDAEITYSPSSESYHAGSPLALPICNGFSPTSDDSIRSPPCSQNYKGSPSSSEGDTDLAGLSRVDENMPRDIDWDDLSSSRSISADTIGMPETNDIDLVVETFNGEVVGGKEQPQPQGDVNECEIVGEVASPMAAKNKLPGANAEQRRSPELLPTRNLRKRKGNSVSHETESVDSKASSNNNSGEDDIMDFISTRNSAARKRLRPRQ